MSQLIDNVRWAVRPGSIRHRELPDWVMLWLMLCLSAFCFGLAAIHSAGLIIGAEDVASNIGFAYGMGVATIMLFRGLLVVNKVSG